MDNVILSRRDRMLVENRFERDKQRAIRYAITYPVYCVPNGTRRAKSHNVFYQHFVPNGTARFLWQNRSDSGETDKSNRIHTFAPVSPANQIGFIRSETHLFKKQTDSYITRLISDKSDQIHPFRDSSFQKTDRFIHSETHLLQIRSDSYIPRLISGKSDQIHPFRGSSFQKIDRFIHSEAHLLQSRSDSYIPRLISDKSDQIYTFAPVSSTKIEFLK